MNYLIENSRNNGHSAIFEVKQTGDDKSTSVGVTVQVDDLGMRSGLPDSSIHLELWYDGVNITRTPELDKQQALILGTAALQLGATLQQQSPQTPEEQ